MFLEAVGVAFCEAFGAGCLDCCFACEEYVLVSELVAQRAMESMLCTFLDLLCFLFLALGLCWVDGSFFDHVSKFLSLDVQLAPGCIL